MREIYSKILNKIVEYNSIVIARHIGADPDALGSQFGLKQLINELYPDKKVYAVGTIASKFRFMGSTDKIDGVDFSKSLLIVLDVPDLKRIEGIDDVEKFDYIIKIDHHPVVDVYADIELIDITASSASQIVLDMIFNLELELSSEVASKLYLGIVSDTDRFLHDCTTYKTLELVSKLVKTTNINLTSLYESYYMRPLNEVRFQGYIYENMIVNSNGLGYIKISDKTMKEFGVDAASAGNMINNLKYVNEIIVWVFLSEDVKSNIIRANIRSRGPFINEVAIKHGGGGHKYASGVRLNSWEDADKLISDLDNLVMEYKNNK